MGASTFFHILFVVQFVVFTNGQPDKQFFRKDYTYLSSTESFYKIHTLRETWGEAKKRCELEGAVLFHPRDADEACAVIAFWNETQYFSTVYVGLSDLLVQGVFLTVDGHSTHDVYSNWHQGQPDNYGSEHCVTLNRDDGTLNDIPCNSKVAYICKKELKDLQWNKECNFSRTDYIFNQTLERCYKFHSIPKNWTEAVTVCHAEQSHLAFINSQAEADFLVGLARQKNNDKAPGLTLHGQILLGFHNRLGEGWKTIQGQDIEAYGSSVWGRGEPSGDGTCGSAYFKDDSLAGQLNDLSCTDYRGFFICEHEITSISPSEDDDDFVNELLNIRKCNFNV